MSNTLTLLDTTPDWIESLCREIDTLRFASAFDTFTPDAILAFGVKQITGASAMLAFFVKIDSPLNIDHRILEVGILVPSTVFLAKRSFRSAVGHLPWRIRLPQTRTPSGNKWR